VITSIIGGIISIALVFSTLSGYFTGKDKKYVVRLLYPFSLIVLAIFFALLGYVYKVSFYFASYYLTFGTILYLNEFRIIVSEETIGASIWEKSTYESRDKKIPYLNDKSSITNSVFHNKMNFFKGDTILSTFDFIGDARLLARKIIHNCDYAIYISSDRPYTVIEEEYKDYKGKLYCIDCFTNSYGFGEFKQAPKESNSYTLNPPTTRYLHNSLRHIRRRIVSQILCNKDWPELGKEERLRIDKELTSREATAERGKNIWIIYDSISSLSAIFELDELLSFLIHDTTVDMTIGRNTLLLMKEGVLDPTIVSRMESICEHIFKITIRNEEFVYDVIGSTNQHESISIEI
jgi:hypothetical protein